MSDLLIKIVPPLVTGYLRLLKLTCTIREEGVENFREAYGEEGQCIWSVWHNKLLAPIIHLGGKNVGVVISQSKDGEMISRVFDNFGFTSLRGSSSRGGANAMRGILRHAKNGHSVGFTPDGPRGPRYEVQPGIAFTAQRTGLRVLPIGISSTSKKVYASWDRFQMPYPFSTILFNYGKPLSFTKSDAVEDIQEAIKAALIEVNTRADEILGVKSP